MLAHERTGLGEVAGQLLEHTTDLVAGIHRGIANRIFAGLPGSPGVRALHDAVSDVVYTGVGRGGGSLLRVAGRAAGMLPDRGPALTSTPAGATTQAVINGIIGDRLVDQDNSFAIRMGIRHAGRDIDPVADDLAQVYGDVTGRVAVHVHGLTEDEAVFGWSGRRAGVRTAHDEMLDACGLTPVFVRYNSGLRMSENGFELAALLARLDRAWPVPVEEFVLIGHSMGGLVAQSAVVLAADVGEAWVERTRHLVALTSPVHGSGLERVVHRGTVAMARTSTVASVATFLNLRSVGIKDLRHGTIDESWAGVDPDVTSPDQRVATVLPDNIRLHAVGATLQREPDARLTRLFGDGLVTPDSAAGRRMSGWTLDPDTSMTVTRSSHWQVLQHPDVTAHLTQILR